MSSEPLRTGCPTCAGSGSASFLRKGAWLNVHCPKKNGPSDSDDSPSAHVLDNYWRQRKVRIEYKRHDEPVDGGQEYHIRAELESARDEWDAVYLLVVDTGQTSADQRVMYCWRWNKKSTRTWGDWRNSSIDELGKRIAEWLWGE